ncbi:hypothetical protein KCU61_g577, partial [Aureobasidium melanogenum]
MILHVGIRNAYSTPNNSKCLDVPPNALIYRHTTKPTRILKHTSLSSSLRAEAPRLRTTVFFFSSSVGETHGNNDEHCQKQPETFLALPRTARKISLRRSHQ